LLEGIVIFIIVLRGRFSEGGRVGGWWGDAKKYLPAVEGGKKKTPPRPCGGERGGKEEHAGV